MERSMIFIMVKFVMFMCINRFWLLVLFWFLRVVVFKGKVL